MIEGNVVTTTNSDSNGKFERRSLYLRWLRLFLALGFVAIIIGPLVFLSVSLDPNNILLSMYGTAASIFAMSILGLIWVTNETSFKSDDKEWQFQFLVIVGLLLIGTVFMFFVTIIFALPYAIMIYLYLARLIRGA